GGLKEQGRGSTRTGERVHPTVSTTAPGHAYAADARPPRRCPMSSADTSSTPSTPPLPDRAAPAVAPGGPPAPRPRPAGRAPRMSTRRDGMPVVVDCAVYVDGRRHAPVEPEEALRVAEEHGGFVWLGLYE